MWLPISARITLFPFGQGPQPDALVLFRAIWDTDPDSFSRQSNPLYPSTAVGKRGNFQCQSTTHATRVDLLLGPTDPKESGVEVVLDEAPHLSLIEDSAALYVELGRMIEAVRAGNFSANRVALGVQFVQTAKTAAEANQALVAVVPPQYRLQLKDEVDVIVQVNSPQSIALKPELPFNFIRKWSTETVQVYSGFVPIAVSTTGMQLAPMLQPNNYLVSSVAYDINSIVRADALSQDEQNAVLREALGRVAADQQVLGLSVQGFGP